MEVARIAARQHGIASIHQLLGAGLSMGGVRRRVAAGRLHRLYRGVYAVGHAGLSNEGRWMAAVLACGAGAVLSHWSAAALWSTLRPSGRPVDVTIDRDVGRARRPGIRLHRSPSLTDALTTHHKRIPVTAPARTIRDLRRVAAAATVRRATRQAEMIGLPLGELEADGMRSDLELVVFRACKRHGLPLPLRNARVGRHEVDFLWPQRRLIAEADGWKYHRGRQAFEDDRARDLALKLEGFDVVRFADRQIDADPGAVAAAIRALLG